MAGEGTKRIIDLSEAAETQSGDYIAIDSTGRGTRKLPAGFMATAEDLSEEQTARQTADETLDGKITTETENRIAAKNALKAQLEVTGTASGAIATFSDGSTMPMKSCIVSIEPQQSGSGTPSPDNVRQISGWDSVDVYKSGVNIWDEEWEQGDLNSITGEEISSTTYIRGVNYTPCVPNAEYYGKANSKIWLYWYDKDKNFISNTSGGFQNASRTAPATACFFRLVQMASTYDNGTSINYPSTDHEYHAYNGQTITKDLGQTVYGCEVDIVSGLLTVDSVMVTLDGSSDESLNVTPLSGFTQVGWGGYIPIGKPLGNFVSDTFAFTKSGNTYITGLGQIWGSSAPRCFMGLPEEVTDVASARQWLSEHPTTIVYELATPQTYQLAPTEVSTLLGENNVWADSGDVSVVYVRDLNIAINNLIGE